MNITIKKMQSGPRRYLKWRLVSPLEEWLHEVEEMRAFIFNETNLQIVGSGIHFEVDFSTQKIEYVQIEVLGSAPLSLKSGSMVVDQKGQSVFIYEFKGEDIFTLDWGSLLEKSRAIAAKWAQDNTPAPVYHIVYDHAKIGLHFFLEKDYSQMQF